MTINYDFAALGDLSGGLQRAFSELDALNTQLKNQIAALDGNWSSAEAKAAYLDAQMNFDRIFTQSRESLQSLQSGVSNASRIMSDTDSSIASGFRSLA
ncbi:MULTISPECIES: WXG100 family type VII secretion target [Gordonia]|uniref:WXG100 family type VII secretion target n=1 Tax=Gordonia amicalis TaxID=89053 RepID=A0AAE4R0L6_9ACTN|nr:MULTISPECIES: WXG100 family type VII secretion target [Gordonia]ATD71894.1 WXG100 family type VII secretion target [Gordonia sp. 1D]KAF0970142.1 hypothetical protein BPODLACK_01195 [Gordonia sp. YY1]MBA5848788.1 WXG100 family type VII secretion target [Gordonia amicalis]MCR8896245.1 WXG100 family type VII secretion target [Gordonia sp. GONU]MCZ0914364.1 WXG100 family type VII secretion target [Gordonia amicalis]